MTKEQDTVLVFLGNDWYNGGELLRTVDNPHKLSKKLLDQVPSSAKVDVDDKQIPIDEFRGTQSDTEKAEEQAEKDAAKRPAQIVTNAPVVEPKKSEAKDAKDLKL